MSKGDRLKLDQPWCELEPNHFQRLGPPPARCKGTDIAGDPCRGYAVQHLDGLCIGCHELNELCRRHDEWYEEHGGES